MFSASFSVTEYCQTEKVQICILVWVVLLFKLDVLRKNRPNSSHQIVSHQFTIVEYHSLSKFREFFFVSDFSWSKIVINCKGFWGFLKNKPFCFHKYILTFSMHFSLNYQHLWRASTISTPCKGNLNDEIFLQLHFCCIRLHNQTRYFSK